MPRVLRAGRQPSSSRCSALYFNRRLSRAALLAAESFRGSWGSTPNCATCFAARGRDRFRVWNSGTLWAQCTLSMPSKAWIRCQGADDGRSCGRVRVGTHALELGADTYRHSTKFVRQRAADLYSGLTQLAIRVSWQNGMQNRGMLVT